jgi:hypothetical protein
MGVCDRAASLAEEAVAAARRFRLPGVLVMALTRSTQTLLRCGDDPGARETLQELFTLLHQLGTLPFRAEALEAVAVLAYHAGDNTRAARFLAAAQAIRTPRGDDWGVDVLGSELAATRASVGAATIVEMLSEARPRRATEAVADAD